MATQLSLEERAAKIDAEAARKRKRKAKPASGAKKRRATKSRAPVKAAGKACKTSRTLQIPSGTSFRLEVWDSKGSPIRGGSRTKPTTKKTAAKKRAGKKRSKA